MGKRHPNPKLVKIHRNYSVEEVGRLFGLHKNTVRNWLKDGLEAIDKNRPILVHGKVLANFLTIRREKSRRPCPPGHLFCLPCRAPKPPAGNLVEFAPIDEATVSVSAICPTCGRMMYRRASRRRLAEFSEEFTSTFREAQSLLKG
jgi:hypothetical protein